MSQEKKSVLIINAIVNKERMAELSTYLGTVMQVFGKNGGKPVARFKTIENLLGDDSPEMTAIIEFPNDEVIKELMESEDFKALADVRARVFSKLNMLIGETL